MASALLCLCFALLPSTSAAASETDTFRLEPWPLRVDGYERRTFDFDIPPGSRITDAVRLTNKTDEDRRFRLYAADATEDESGRVGVGTFQEVPDGVGSWIELDTTELLLEPGEARIVAFEVTRPKEADAEGAGAVVAEEVRDPTGAGVDVVYRLAILVRSEGKAPDLAVAHPSLEVPLTIVPEHGEISTQIRNDTLGAVQAHVRFKVDSITGREWLLEPETIALAAGEEARVAADWASVPRWGGLLRPSVEVTWHRGSYVAPGDRRVYPPLWLLALVIVAVGIRSLREIWTRWQQSRTGQPEAAPDLVHSATG